MTKIQIIESIIVLIVYMAVRFILHRYVNKFISINIPTKSTSKIVKKAINLIFFLILIIVLLSIFGVDQSELFLFIGSALTVMGIALFAQWSILSNITSGVIIFFNHSTKLDDYITIIDKDYEIEGRISDIGLFFIILKTVDNHQIEIPNSLFLNKMIKKKING